EVKRAGDRSLAQVEAQVLGSREYYVTRGQGTIDGFLTALAQDVTGSPFPAGLRAGYARQLRRGTPRSPIALQVINSPRGIQAQVTDVYVRALGVPPDPKTLARLTRTIEQGGQITQVINALLISEAFFKKSTAT